MKSSLDVEADEGALAPRQQWMQVLACAGKQLAKYDDALRQDTHRYIRPAEIGMVMVRGRTGASGEPFNLGEMTVTRCVVQLADGCHGYSYVAGRSKAHAELAALADAHLQGERRDYWMTQLIEPLHREQVAARAAKEAQSAATKVDFVTMVRGEDD
ncbi:phosphonate C-P lyase system protein PhnG [Pollutimonas harenae]|uniref:Phosphonate C-P lyase system protein PhnG n=1 Tax=Pollutimonas harenae TaxID=657015 RepID=A0A853H215_9BURK|nr:phosphonate C-P lyase system protein PhnG [Pollutimonas harenae]NYT85839.1 phosphonate C-P lyase system protein PhnG [Pollutimonas harenae]TEA70897.1 phosphonate C-P lyase system protein PhnG [Pollutimonas harenae]